MYEPLQLHYRYPTSLKPAKYVEIFAYTQNWWLHCCYGNKYREYSPIFTEPKANNCFSIITQVKYIRENQRIDCQTFLFTLFPEVVCQWTATNWRAAIFEKWPEMLESPPGRWLWCQMTYFSTNQSTGIFIFTCVIILRGINNILLKCWYIKFLWLVRLFSH